MFEQGVLPILQGIRGESSGPGIPELTMSLDLGESAVEELIGMELSQRGDIEVGYCARPNEVDFRFIAPRAVLEEVEPRVLGALWQDTWSPWMATLSKRSSSVGSPRWGRPWRARGILHRRVARQSHHQRAGRISRVLLEGIVTYSNEAKIRSLSVPESLIAAHGAVSEPVARAMAEGAAARSGADFGIGITGIAGPAAELSRNQSERCSSR